MSLRSQSGFSLVESLLAIVAVALIVFTGLYVYHVRTNANQNLDKSLTSSNKTSATKTQN